LIRPQGRCVFTNSSCLLFDSPQSTVPFLQGTKNPNSDLWFLQVPPQPPPNHSPTILFSLQELPCARFVACLLASSVWVTLLVHLSRCSRL
jgi:hypothetical protein